MTDIFDQGTENEERDRERALRLQALKFANSANTQEAVCSGCSYATRKSWGYTCDAWKECLADAVRVRLVK